MAEIGLAILFILVLVAFDSERYSALRERMNEMVDWIDRPE